MKRQNTCSLPEEILNSVTHGLGLIMGLAVCIFFLVKGSASDTWIAPFSLVLYLIGVCCSYAASTIYHSILSDFCRGSRENYQQPVGHIAKLILKAAIRKELDEVLALRCSYSVGDPAVTVVTIR